MIELSASRQINAHRQANKKPTLLEMVVTSNMTYKKTINKLTLFVFSIWTHQKSAAGKNDEVNDNAQLRLIKVLSTEMFNWF
jgi:hypothetical protein